MGAKAINLATRVAATDGQWNPSHVLTLDNSHSLKVAKIQGEFIWHSHPETDELFYCVSGGPMTLELCTKASSPAEAERLGKDDEVELQVGDVYCVRKGVQHRPVAERETGILMVEKVGTVNTGDAAEGEEGKGRTRVVDEGQG